MEDFKSLEEVNQFDVWTCDFENFAEFAGYGIRPCIIVSNDANNKFSPTINVIPLTSSSKNPLPTHCIISSTKVASYAVCENVTTIYKSRLRVKVGEITEFEKQNIIHCLKMQLNIL